MSNPRPPKGWSSWDPNSGERNRPVECGCCEWKGHEDDIEGLWECDGLHERLDPGSVVPVGECLACGSFAYYSDTLIAYRRVPNLLEQIVEATE